MGGAVTGHIGAPRLYAPGHRCAPCRHGHRVTGTWHGGRHWQWTAVDGSPGWAGAAEAGSPGDSLDQPAAARQQFAAAASAVIASLAAPTDLPPWEDGSRGPATPYSEPLVHCLWENRWMLNSGTRPARLYDPQRTGGGIGCGGGGGRAVHVMCPLPAVAMARLDR